MPRQPFLKKNPNSHYYINQNCINDRPEMAAIIGRCLLTWSLVDAEMSLILSTLLDARSDAAIAVYLSLQNSRAQREALHAAAKVKLSGIELELFMAMLKIHESSNGERNDLAHGIFGIVSDEKDQLIWCPSVKFAAWMAKANQKAWNLEFDTDPHAPLRNELFIYTKADLEAIFQQFSFVFDVVSRMHMALSPIQEASEYGRQWLLEQPKIQERLTCGKAN